MKKKLFKTMEEALRGYHKFEDEAGKGMVKITDDVKWISFGKEHTPTEKKRKKRAFAYALTITALDDVGAGADENLQDIRSIIAMIKGICLRETGYLIGSYVINLVGSDYSGWKKNPFTEK